MEQVVCLFFVFFPYSLQHPLLLLHLHHVWPRSSSLLCGSLPLRSVSPVLLFNPFSPDLFNSPFSADLTLVPDLVAWTFSGEEHVSLTVHEATTSISFNCHDVEILQASLDSSLTPASITHDPTRETTTLVFATEVAPGPHKLFLSLSGVLNDQLAGFYRSEYTTPQGEKRFMAATQFEATDARRAFPCWDEPALKATFKVRWRHLGVSAELSS